MCKLGPPLNATSPNQGLKLFVTQPALQLLLEVGLGRLPMRTQWCAYGHDYIDLEIEKKNSCAPARLGSGIERYLNEGKGIHC